MGAKGIKGINAVTLQGYVGKDPEQKGNGPVKFGVGVSNSWRDKTGDWQKKTSWFNCIAWGELGQQILQEVGKGYQIRVEGKLDANQWTNKDGVKQTTYQVVVWKFAPADDSALAPHDQDQYQDLDQPQRGAPKLAVVNDDGPGPDDCPF